MVSAFSSYSALLPQPAAEPCSVLMSCPTAHPPCPAVAGPGPSASSSLLSQHDSSPFLLLCVRCFQACFSHSCWLSQPKLHEQIPLTPGSIPMHPGWGTPGKGVLGLSTPWIPQLWLTLVPSVTYSV